MIPWQQLNKFPSANSLTELRRNPICPRYTFETFNVHVMHTASAWRCGQQRSDPIAAGEVQVWGSWQQQFPQRCEVPPPAMRTRCEKMIKHQSVAQADRILGMTSTKGDDAGSSRLAQSISWWPTSLLHCTQINLRQ